MELIFLTLDLEIISSYFSELITSPSRAILNILFSNWNNTFKRTQYKYYLRFTSNYFCYEIKDSAIRDRFLEWYKREKDAAPAVQRSLAPGGYIRFLGPLLTYFYYFCGCGGQGRCEAEHSTPRTWKRSGLRSGSVMVGRCFLNSLSLSLAEIPFSWHVSWCAPLSLRVTMLDDAVCWSQCPTMNGVNLLVDSHAHVALGRVLSHDPFLPINIHFLFERYIDYESCIMVEILIVVLIYVVFFTTDGSRISRRDRNERGSFRRIFAFWDASNEGYRDFVGVWERWIVSTSSFKRDFEFMTSEIWKFL